MQQRRHLPSLERIQSNSPYEQPWIKFNVHSQY